MPALSIRSLRKSFLIGPAHSVQRREALDGIDLDVEEGDVLGVVGNEGAGKTTLLLCAAGMLRGDSGSIYWYGKRFAGGGCLPGLAYVPAVPAYYPFLTVRDVLTHYSLTDDIPSGRRSQLIDHAAACLSLTDHLATPIGRLTVECLKRVGIAQAFAEEPRVILLDATLDGLGAAPSCAHRAISEAAGRGATVIVTSRHAGIAASVATRIVVLDGGHVRGSFLAERDAAWPLARDSVFADPPSRMRQIAERVH